MGVQNAGVFYSICSECDNTVFQVYEDESVYKNKPSQQVLAAIALKCSLQNIYKRNFEKELYKLIYKNYEEIFNCQQIERTNELDLRDYNEDLKKARICLNKADVEGYYLIYYTLLNYTVPIAFQGKISLYVGFDGKVINDIYNYNPNYKIKGLYISVFPLKNSTAILLFIDQNENRYRSFYKPFKKLSEQDKLSVINYLIFLYSEDFFCSCKIKSIIENNKIIQEISGLTSIAEMSIEDITPIL